MFPLITHWLMHHCPAKLISKHVQIKSKCTVFLSAASFAIIPCFLVSKQAQSVYCGNQSFLLHLSETMSTSMMTLSKESLKISFPCHRWLCNIAILLSLPKHSILLIYCMLFSSGSVTRINFTLVEETVCELSITTAN